jgi:hypothetical protein
MGLDTEPGRRSPLTGWSLAAALGLVAAAFLVERLAPAENEAVPERKTKRDASAVGLTEGGDRGRLAASPSEIPAEGWKDILMRVYSNVGDHRILSLAAGMTYYSLLAIFPALAALVAIYGLFSDTGTIAKHLDEVSGFMPGGAIDVARDQLTRVASKGNQTLGLTFIRPRSAPSSSCPWSLTTFGSQASPTFSFAVYDGRPCFWSWRWASPASTASGQVVRLHVGDGSHGAAARPRYFGWVRLHSSPGTPPISASSTRHTVRWVRRSDS